MDVIELNPDIIELGELDEPVLKLDTEESQPRPSVNFGSGIELLMNDKKTEKKSSSNVEIDDITRLEDELNDLSETINSEPTTNKKIDESSSNKNIFSGLFSEKKDGSNVKTVNQNNEEKTNLGKATSNMNENKTWDGFGKFNNVPINLDKVEERPQLTKEEELKEKFKYLRKLEDLERKGVNLSKRYNMDSNLQEMMGEYETIVAEKEKTNSIKFQGKMLMAAITGIEFLNNRFDPFDIKLDGLGEQVNENISDYDEIFGELHEKYKSKAKMAPELKLLFQLAGSAIMVHMTNTMFKSSMPGMDDIMRQNPELMQQFQNAAMNTMGQQNPGFGQFMGGVMGGPPPMTMPPMGSPPGPDDSMRQSPPRMSRARTNRPDIEMSRSNTFNDAIDPRDNFQSVKKSTRRPEMKGPSDLDDILSGLKTKKINLKTQKDKDSASVVSISELNDMKDSLEKPKKSRRKPKSERNTISLNFN